MDVEQLKMVLETIQNMGGDAKDFGMIWLISQAIPPILIHGFWALFAIITAINLFKFTKNVIEIFSVGRKIANALDITIDGEWNKNDTNRVINKIFKLKQN